MADKDKLVNLDDLKTAYDDLGAKIIAVDKVDDVAELKSAINFVPRFKAADATAMLGGDDADDFTTPGNYIVANNTTAGNVSHLPAAVGGRLFVLESINTTRLIQIYITNHSPVDLYMRQYSGSWNAWKKMAYTADLDDLAAHVVNLNSSNPSVSTNSDLDTYLTPGNYSVDSAADAQTIDNIPQEIAGRLLVMSATSALRVVQMFFTNDTTVKMYMRYYNGTKWFDWHSFADNGIFEELSAKSVVCTETLITSDNYTSYFSDYNDIPVNTVWNISDNVPLLNSPPGNTVLNDTGVTRGYVGGTVVTFCGSGSKVRQRMQIFTTRSTLINQSLICVRTGATNNGVIVWSPWQKFSNFLNLSASNVVIRAATASEHFTDLDDAPINSIYQIDLDCVDGVLAHHPNPGKSNVLVTLGFSYTSRHGMIQFCIGLAPGTTAAMWFRYGFINQPNEYIWTPWAKVATE